MIDKGKRSILGVKVNVIDCKATVERVIESAKLRRMLGLTAIAVHGVMTGRLDPVQRFRLNKLNLVVPDGQPVRWALALIHGESLPSRVYGPDLMLDVCAEAARQNLPIFLYGSRIEVLRQLSASLLRYFPDLLISGITPSCFRRLTRNENDAVVGAIKSSGARIVFVGLGCPRQEIWVYENASKLEMPVLAVGAAFDFHARLLRQAPSWMQQCGFEWLYRLVQEPRRLWRRYLILNPLFCWNLLLQLTNPDRFEKDDGVEPTERVNVG